MLSTKYAVLAGLAIVATANAGQIQIGGANGLTNAYVTGSGATGGWSQRPYMSGLFSSVTNSGAGLPTTTNTTGALAGPQTMTDARGIVFSMINDGPVALNSTYNYIWASQNGGAPGTINVPVNVSGTQAVYVMLSDYTGYAGLNATIAFNFASGTDTISLVNLANGLGAIRSAVQCTAATGSTHCPSTTPNANVVSASSPATVNTNISGDATIVTRSIYSNTYSGGAAGQSNDYYNNLTTAGSSSGNITLDELKFTFSTDYSNTTLLSISITPGSVSGITPGTQNDRLGLSAITVVTPEPSSMILLGTGFVALAGFGRRRTRKA